MSSVSTVTITGTGFNKLVHPLSHLEGTPYTEHLQMVIEALRGVTRLETSVPVSTTPPTPEWERFMVLHAEHIHGQHLETHGSIELGDPVIVNTIQEHADLMGHILRKHYTPPDPTMFSPPFSPATPEHILREHVLPDFHRHTTQGNRNCVGTSCEHRAVLGTYRKKADDGYDKPYNLQFMLKVPGLRVQKRAVRVFPPNAHLVLRHGSDLSFEVINRLQLVETEYMNTIVLTYWVHLPLPGTANPVKWTFGTGYVGDTFPRAIPSLLNNLQQLMKNPDAHSPETTRALITNEDTMYALMPPTATINTMS